MSAELFRETSAQSLKEGIPDKQDAIDTEDPQPIRKVQTRSPSLPAGSGQTDIFPRKVKSKLVKIKPALWEKTEESLKNTILKKEKRKNKLG
eukprot:GFUD01131429.1.p1 GENE.GFUD01131429.1~~GFUD01131429.1.p1  ORF type:complete len:100 (+),score=37.95 GFUD01131429.1:27-302(+)